MPKPSSKRPIEHVVIVSDATRVPVPTISRDAHLPRYSITPLGRVYRDDGRLLLPYYNDNQIKVQFTKGMRRWLPKLVFLAFGHPDLLARWHAGDLRTYDPWVDPFDPNDELSGRTACTVESVVLVPRKDLIRRGMSSRRPPIQLSILSPAP